MGRTYQETGLSELGNRTNVSTMRSKFIYVPVLILTGITSFALGANTYTQSTINNTLKLCNQKPLECKFKYDMVMYEETGRVPYTQPIIKDKK
jgi:hypothetical protein